MRPQLSALPRRSYHLARRSRRFLAMERRARTERAAGRTRAVLVRDGFTSDRLLLYPGITDRETRARYISDLTTLRYRMFNGKSGELLTQKEVLLGVLKAHTDWPLEHRVVRLLADDADPATTLRRQAGERGIVVVLRSMESRPPRLMDLEADPTTDTTGLPLGWSTLLLLGEDPAAFDAAHNGATVVRITTYWGPETAFVGHTVAASGSGERGWAWPVFGPGAQLLRVDGDVAATRARLQLTRRADGALTVADGPSLPLPMEALQARVEEVSELATRFPNLRAVTWSFLVLGDELRFVDASNRLDLPYAQVFGPLLADPRLLAAYADAGAREAQRLLAARRPDMTELHQRDPGNGLDATP